MTDVLKSRLYRICEVIARIIYGMGLFVIGAIPLFTFGTSFCAMLETFKYSDKKVGSVFFRAYKRNFFRSWSVLIFNGFSLLFILQTQYIFYNIPMRGLVNLFVISFLVAYNINAYLLLGAIKKINIVFFREVFIFTIMTFHKSFLIPSGTLVFLFVLPIIGMARLLILVIPVILYGYVKMIEKEMRTFAV